jgi:hypothetical protein
VNLTFFFKFLGGSRLFAELGAFRMKRVLPWGIAFSAVALLLWIPKYRSRPQSANSRALSAVRGIVITALEEAATSPDRCFRLADATPEQLKRFGYWVRKRPEGSQCFAAPKICLDDGGRRQIAAFCATPYEENPQRWLSSGAKKHAVAFSDGGAALISAEEYGALDQTNFLRVDEP